MKKFRPDPSDTIVINATNIGFKYHGIGMYSLRILKGLTQFETDLRFLVYLNKSCQPHIRDINFPENFTVKWVSDKISPDRKFKGHLLRLIYSNYLSLKYRKFLIYNTSQLEINFFRSNQVVTIHDVIPLLFKEYHKKQYPYFKLILKYGLKYARFILTPSNHSKKQLQKIYSIPDDKIKVIYNGADTPVETKESESPVMNSEYILYIGRISKMKNVQNILKAFALVSNHIEHKLVIVGDDEKTFRQEIKLSGINQQCIGKIIFIENISENEKCKLMSNASLLVYPSLYEGFGLPPVEAMACGCPVIVSNNSSLPEVCGKAAFYVNPENCDEIAKAVTEVLSNEKLREKMATDGIEQAKKFNWTVSSYEHLKVLEHVLRHSRFPQLNKGEIQGLIERVNPVVFNTAGAQS